jgi:hypothetical protein
MKMSEKSRNESMRTNHFNYALLSSIFPGRCYNFIRRIYSEAVQDDYAFSLPPARKSAVISK